MKIIVRPEPERFSQTGTAWRAYESDGRSLYMGAETLPALMTRIRDFYPAAVIEEQTASFRFAGE